MRRSSHQVDFSFLWDNGLEKEASLPKKSLTGDDFLGKRQLLVSFFQYC
jgi:hypothetical protein